MNDGKIYGYLDGNADTMRHITVVLIALLAYSMLMPAIVAQLPGSSLNTTLKAPVGLSNKLAPLAEPAQNTLYTTPSVAAFLNDSWTPSGWVPDRFYASASPKSLNGTIQNTTYAAYDFLNDSYKPPAATSPLYYATAQNKEGVIPYTGEAIYEFLDDKWTPNTPVDVVTVAPYKMHQMN